MTETILDSNSKLIQKIINKHRIALNDFAESDKKMEKVKETNQALSDAQLHLIFERLVKSKNNKYNFPFFTIEKFIALYRDLACLSDFLKKVKSISSKSNVIFTHFDEMLLNFIEDALDRLEQPDYTISEWQATDNFIRDWLNSDCDDYLMTLKKYCNECDEGEDL